MNSSQSLRVLVVDDDEKVIQLVRTLLQNAGHRVTAVSDAADAVSAIASQPFDVILTDVLLGADDGLTVVRAGRNMQPQARIVVMSGGGVFLQAPHCLNLGTAHGACASLAKPFTANEFFAAIGIPRTAPAASAS